MICLYLDDIEALWDAEEFQNQHKWKSHLLIVRC